MATNIFNIQRFSVHDGDGIRTTVFFSGCPLSCLWCHNPEGENFLPSLLYSGEKCVGCGACAAICKSGAISFKDGIISQDFKKCSACGACVPVCRADARSIAGKPADIDEIVRICVSDRMFYESSGGGVTLSGGEVMAQNTDFLLKLTCALYDEGISVNIDTCGFAPWEKFEAILPYTDTFLYDIKSADRDKHKRCTGVDNELILDNLHRLSDSGASIYIRLPVIAPAEGASDNFDGANYTDGDIMGIIDVLSEIKYKKICLLPYHDTGSYKRASLGMDAGAEFSVPSAGRIDEIKSMLESAGCKPVQTGG